MSAVKSFALGVSLMAIAAPGAFGGSMHPSAAHRRHDAGRIQAEPTTLVYAPTPTQALPSPTLNLTHAVGAENIAPTFSRPDPSNVGFSPTPAMVSGGLTLGLFSGSSSSFAAPAPAPAPASSYISYGPAFSYATPAFAPTPTPAPATPDAYINFGNGPFREAASLTTGNAQSFLSSPAFNHFFNAGGPSPTDVTNFESEVLATIKATYNNANLPINLTTDPNAHAAHTLSVVSGTSYAQNPGAIGITEVGSNGFSFIDKLAGTQSVDQLAVAVGHNLSHELMHAFGIADHPEQSGPYVDAASTTLQALADPSTGFSQAAASLLSTLNFQAVGLSLAAGAQRIDGDQLLVGSPSPVPEPSTLAAFVVLGGLVVARRRRKAG